MDERAKKILLDMFWSSAGWKQPVKMPKAADLKHAKAHGLMFAPVTHTHDSAVQWAIKMRKQTPRESVARGFLSGLSTRRLDWRSAIGSAAVLTNLAKHPFKRSVENFPFCDCCGLIETNVEDLNVLNFERIKFGGVRHDNIVYAAFDLWRFGETDVPDPTLEDRQILQRILDVCSSQPAKSIASKLATALRPALASSNEERRQLITMLSLAGVLRPKRKQAFVDSWIRSDDRDEGDSDWDYPIEHWRGSDGVHLPSVKLWFSDWL